MGSVTICKYLSAKNPYLIAKEDLRIYSTEELCFYFVHHIYDVDSTVINGNLANWLKYEIGAVRLSGILNQQIAAKTPVLKMLEMILVDLDYLSKEEIHRIVYKQTLPITPAQEAENLGNLFLQQEKFEKAVKAFRKAIRYRKQERLDELTEAALYEKLGIAYARLFLYNDAAEAFALSYMKNPLKRTKELYSATIEMGANPVDGMEESGFNNVREYYNQKNSLEQRIIDNTYKSIVDKLSNIDKLKADGDEAAYRVALDDMIAEIKEKAKKQM